jgi:hypothetical protein
MAGALGSAIGIEIVGILSGVTLERFWRIDDRPRAVLALFLLITYTIVAMYILRHNTILWPIPIIAAVVYLVSALAESAGEIIEQQVTSQADDAAWQRRQEEQEAEFERQLKLQQQRDRTAVKLAKLGAFTLPGIVPTAAIRHLQRYCRLAVRLGQSMGRWPAVIGYSIPCALIVQRFWTITAIYTAITITKTMKTFTMYRITVPAAGCVFIRRTVNGAYVMRRNDAHKSNYTMAALGHTDGNRGEAI